MSKVTLICGLTSTGKSTLTRELQKQHYFSSLVLMRCCSRAGVKPHWKAIAKLCQEHSELFRLPEFWIAKPLRPFYDLLAQLKPRKFDPGRFVHLIARLQELLAGDVVFEGECLNTASVWAAMDRIPNLIRVLLIDDPYMICRRVLTRFAGEKKEYLDYNVVAREQEKMMRVALLSGKNWIIGTRESVLQQLQEMKNVG